MKFPQKLEAMLGVAFFLSNLAYVYFIYIPSQEGIAKIYNELPDYHWQFMFLWFIVPSVLMIIATYLHASKNSYIALALIVLWGGIISCLTFLAFAIGSAFEGHPWIGISPGIFAFATLVLAIINTTIHLKARKNLS